MNARFFAPDANEANSDVELPSDEAAHASRVLRLAVGSTIALFNGRGDEFVGLVTSVTKAHVRVRLGERVTPLAELPVSITLAHAVLKGDKMDDVVRDAVMLGVAALQPIVTTRTEVSLAALARGDRVERWRRIAVSSAKQCGRAVVPAISAPMSVDEPGLLEGLPSPQFFLLEPGAGATASRVTDVPSGRPAVATIVVGPEGGWTDEEIALARPHGRALGLGGLTLRADAAAVVAVTALLTRWDAL